MQTLTKTLLAMYASYRYPTKVIAFCKVKYPDNYDAVMIPFVLNPNEELRDFCERITSPVHRKTITTRGNGNRITAHNLRYISFHAKVKGEKSITLASNPEYLISWSPRRGFFDKRRDKTTNRV